MNMRTRSILVRACAMLGMASLVTMSPGCGGDGVRLVPVAGTVTLDGKPLEGATVTFVPAPGSAVSTSGSDVTGPEGNFQMTFKGRAGLSPGKYTVRISKTEDVPRPDGRKVPEVFAKAKFERMLMGAAKETIPDQNFDMEVEVPPGGAKDFALDFKSKGKS